MSSGLSKTSSNLDRFLFQHGNVQIAAAMRIVFAILVLINTILWWTDATFWFSDSGVLSTSGAKASCLRWNWSLLFLLPSNSATIQVGLGLLCLHALLLLLGIGCRVQALGIFVWLTSFQHRNPLICDGEDTVLRLFAFYFIFLPTDGTFSLWKRSGADLFPVDGQTWALRLFQIQMTLIYFSNAWNKGWGSGWQDGSALFVASRMTDYFGRGIIPTSWFEIPWLVQSATWGVLAVEALLPIALWIPRTRLLAIALGLILHLGIELTMNLFLFEWVMILGLMSFLRTSDFHLFSNHPSPQTITPSTVHGNAESSLGRVAGQ